MSAVEVSHWILRQFFVSGKQYQLLATRLCHQHPVKGISGNPRQAAGLHCVGIGIWSARICIPRIISGTNIPGSERRRKSPEKYLIAISQTDAEEKYEDDAELERTLLARPFS